MSAAHRVPAITERAAARSGDVATVQCGGEVAEGLEAPECQRHGLQQHHGGCRGLTENESRVTGVRPRVYASYRAVMMASFRCLPVCFVTMGKAASAQSKEGYETVPVVDAAEEAAQFMTCGKKAGKPAKKPVAPVEERAWESHLFCCFGRCDSVGWSSCLISYFAPCVAFGCVPTRTQIFPRSFRTVRY